MVTPVNSPHENVTVRSGSGLNTTLDRNPRAVLDASAAVAPISSGLIQRAHPSVCSGGLAGRTSSIRRRPTRSMTTDSVTAYRASTTALISGSNESSYAPYASPDMERLSDVGFRATVAVRSLA